MKQLSVLAVAAALLGGCTVSTYPVYSRPPVIYHSPYVSRPPVVVVPRYRYHAPPVYRVHPRPYYHAPRYYHYRR